METVMIIEFNLLSIAMGEWEKEKKQMTAMEHCGDDVVVDASSTTKTGWRFKPAL